MSFTIIVGNQLSRFSYLYIEFFFQSFDTDFNSGFQGIFFFYKLQNNYKTLQQTKSAVLVVGNPGQ